MQGLEKTAHMNVNGDILQVHYNWVFTQQKKCLYYGYYFCLFWGGGVLGWTSLTSLLRQLDSTVQNV